MRKSFFYLLTFLLAFVVGSFLVYSLYWKSKENTKVLTVVSPETVALDKLDTSQPANRRKIFDQNGEEIFWQGESGDFKIRWTDKDIYVEKNGKTKNLYTDYGNFLFRKNLRSLKSIDRYCVYSPIANINSLVGNLMSIEIDEMTSCEIEAHPSNKVYWIVFDLNNPSRLKFLNGVPYSLKLTDFFSDKEILDAMLENEEIENVIATIDPNYKPKTYLELIYWFKKKEIVNFEHSEGQLNENSLAAFSFSRIQENYVFVNIGLSAYRHSSWLELKFRVPEKLKKQLELANSEKDGFLESTDGFTRKEFEVGKKTF